MTGKRTAPLSVRLSPELNTRLEETAKRLRMKKHTLAQEAIEAAVEAIEANDYKLVLPVKFDVTHVASEKTSSNSNYPSLHQHSDAFNEKPDKKKAAS